MTQFCKHCGHLLPDGAKFCDACGASTEEAKTPFAAGANTNRGMMPRFRISS